MNNNIGLDFLWTWAVVPSRSSALHRKVVSQHALLCSALSVKKWYPEARRRFIVDVDTYDLLKRNGWDKLWDSIEVVDFPRTEGFEKYYAYPKLYTYRFVERPTVILDVEVIVTGKVNIGGSRVVGCRRVFDWDERDPILGKDFRRWIEYSKDFFPTRGNSYVTSYCLYIPSKEVGEYTSEKTCKHIDTVLQNVHHIPGEEAVLFLEDGYIAHCFEEVCGIDFSSSDDWNSTFKHFGGDKYFINNTINRMNESIAGLVGVYEDYFKPKNKNSLI